MALTLACAAPLPGPKVLEIRNQSRIAITSLRLTPCGSDENREMLREEIDPGHRFHLPLPYDCVHLLATDSRGRVAGEQRDLEPLSDATWTLR